MATPKDTLPPASPELIVLEALKGQCEQVRKHNSNPEIAKVALKWELKFAADLEKLTGGAGREVAKAA